MWMVDIGRWLSRVFILGSVGVNVRRGWGFY